LFYQNAIENKIRASCATTVVGTTATAAGTTATGVGVAGARWLSLCATDAGTTTVAATLVLLGALLVLVHAPAHPLRAAADEDVEAEKERSVLS
jgi:hypothetical protein